MLGNHFVFPLPAYNDYFCQFFSTTGIFKQNFLQWFSIFACFKYCALQIAMDKIKTVLDRFETVQILKGKNWQTFVRGAYFETRADVMSNLSQNLLFMRYSNSWDGRDFFYYLFMFLMRLNCMIKIIYLSNQIALIYHAKLLFR